MPQLTILASYTDGAVQVVLVVRFEVRTETVIDFERMDDVIRPAVAFLMMYVGNTRKNLTSFIKVRCEKPQLTGCSVPEVEKSFNSVCLRIFSLLNVSTFCLNLGDEVKDSV